MEGYINGIVNLGKHLVDIRIDSGVIPVRNCGLII